MFEVRIYSRNGELMIREQADSLLDANQIAYEHWVLNEEKITITVVSKRGDLICTWLK